MVFTRALLLICLVAFSDWSAVAGQDQSLVLLCLLQQYTQDLDDLVQLLCQQQNVNAKWSQPKTVKCLQKEVNTNQEPTTCIQLSDADPQQEMKLTISSGPLFVLLCDLSSDPIPDFMPCRQLSSFITANNPNEFERWIEDRRDIHATSLNYWASHTHPDQYAPGKVLDAQFSTIWTGVSNTDHVFPKSSTNSDEDSLVFPWLLLKMPEELSIVEVAIIPRDDCCQEELRYRYFEVRVGNTEITEENNNGEAMITDNQLCSTDVHATHSESFTMVRCQKPIKGRYVSLQKTRKGPDQYLEFAEVEVKIMAPNDPCHNVWPARSCDKAMDKEPLFCTSQKGEDNCRKACQEC